MVEKYCWEGAALIRGVPYRGRTNIVIVQETFSRDDLERIVFYELSTRLLFYVAQSQQSVISDDRPTSPIWILMVVKISFC